MTEMIERVARALFAQECREFAQWPGTEENQEYWRAAARAAIEAMREPTEAMLEASWAATRDMSPDERMPALLATGRDAHQIKTKHRYAAMIDAALT